ncbi:MAG: VCBS repeat-containing protein, partial [Pseudodesulfovibrio sp.]|nr:VCBS repeat-containing protein [Pseudodesulfovibrio sp.]
MANRRLHIVLTALLAILILATPAIAQNTKEYAILPFAYNGPQKFSYFPKAFQASLNNDLEWLGHVEPTSKSLSDIPAPNSTAESLKVLQGLGIDYLVTGTIAILDKTANLEMKVLSSDGKEWRQKGQMEIDEITPWLDAQSRAVMGDVFNRPGYSTTQTSKEEDNLKRSAAPTSSAFIMANNGDYTTDALNPQFRYEGGTENIGRWRSQTLR